MYLNYTEVITVSKDTALWNVLSNITKLYFYFFKLLSQKYASLVYVMCKIADQSIQRYFIYTQCTKS